MSDNSRLISDALLRTDPSLFSSIDGQNSWRDGIKERGERVAKYRRYERGQHDSSLTTQMRKMLRLSTDGQTYDFNLNYARIIIDKMASRLRVSEITTSNEIQDAWITETLQANDFESLQGVFYRGAIRDGDSFAMVDPETLKWTAEPAYDGFSGIVAVFSPMQRYPLWACKLWSEADAQDLAGKDNASTVAMKIMVYQPNRITAWTGNVNSGEVMPDNIYGGGNELAWGVGVVPIIHFSDLVDSYTQYGESEIRVSIAPQDVLNRTLHSMVMASEFAAFKIAWSIGMEIDKAGITPGAVLNLVLQDAAGHSIVDMTAEQIEFLKAVRVGEFSESDISQYTNQLDAITKHVSQISQTPIYGVTAEGNLSGEALRQLETGLIGKVQRFQRENTGAIKQLLELTAAIQNGFNTGSGSAPALTEISVNWASAEILDVNAAIQSILSIAEKKPNLFSDDFLRQRIGALLGMTQSQITAEGLNRLPESGELVKAQARVQSINAGIPLVTLLRREGWDEAEINQMLADKQRMDEQTKTAGEALLNTLRIKQQQANPDDIMTQDATQQAGAGGIPQNIAAEKGLNGAQISSAVQVLTNVSSGITASEVAIELLISLGIDEERVRRMVAATKLITLDANA